MQTGAKPKASDDRRDFVVIPSDQVRVAPSDAEITDLLRAAARQHSEVGVRAAPDPDTPVPTVDATFRATVSDDSPASGPTWGRRLMRALAALLVAGGITGAALGWQVFGYTAKKAFGRWLPQLALTSSLTMDKFGFGAESKPADKPADAAADAAPASVAPAQNAADSGTPEGSVAPAATAAAAAPSPDPAQQLQSMAHDLANANQEIETLKASIAELKASQQQMAHDLAKTSEKLAEQGAKARVAATAPRPAAHRPSSPYSTTSTYSPSPTPAPPAAYRPATSSYSVQASVPPPPATAQTYAPPPIPLQPEPGSTSVPRPPMPVQ